MADADVQGMLVRIEATTAQLRQEMARGDTAVGQSASKIDASLGKVDQAFDRAGSSAKTLQQAIASAASGFGGFNIAAVGSVAGLVALTSSTIDHAREVKNLASVANASVEEFQRMAFGAKSVGIEQDKLADIYKDTNDRIGEFLQRGGGEMADFFKEIAPQVGVTAAQFKNLSGPQGLQLYYSSLEKAGLNQQQLTTYMEAMGDESTALIPLLRDGGKGFQDMGDRATQLGLVISKLNVDRLVDAGQAVKELKATFAGAGQQLVIGLLPGIESVTRGLADLRDNGGAQKLGEIIAFLAENVDILAAALGGKLAAAFAKYAIDAVTSSGLATKAFLENIAATKASAIAKVEEAAAASESAAAKLRESVAAASAANAVRAEAVARVANLQAVRESLGYQVALATGTAEESKLIASLAAIEVELAAAKTAATRATEAQVIASGAAAGAMARDTAATQANATAQVEAAAAKNLLARAGTGLLGLLGGPAGVAALAIGAGVAFLTMGGNAKTAETSLDNLKRSVEEARKEFQALTRDQQRSALVTSLREQEQVVGEAKTAYDDLKQSIQQSVVGPRGGGASQFRELAASLDQARAAGKPLSDVLAQTAERLKIPESMLGKWVQQAGNVSTLDVKTKLLTERQSLYRQELDTSTKSTNASTDSNAVATKATGDYQKALEKQLNTLQDKAAVEAANRVLSENKVSAQSKEGQALLATAAAIDKQKAADQEATKVKSAANSAAQKAVTLTEGQAKALKDLKVEADIAIASASGLAAAYLAGTDKSREFTLQQKVEEALLKTGAAARDEVTAKIKAQMDAQDKLAVSKSTYDLGKETADLIAQAKATLQGAEALAAYNAQKSLTIALASKNIEVGSKEYEQLLAANKAQQDALKIAQQAANAGGIMDRLYPEAKLLKDYTEDQKALNAAMELYPQNSANYQAALVKLGNEYEVNRSKATLWGQMTEGAIDRIDEAFASAWGNIGEGASTLWDNLKSGFKQTLGEIAHMLTTKPLLASISNWLTGTDNGQGLSSVWGKLIGAAGGSSSSSGSTSAFGGLANVGQNLLSAWNAITGVGSSVASGYASGGVSGAISGGASYYGNMLSNISSMLSKGFTSLVSTITGTAAVQTVATIGAQGVTSAVLSGAVTEGATAIGAQFTTGVATTTAATYAAAEAGAAATAASLGGQISAAMSSAAAMWPLAIIMGMYQSGKLYSAGVRPDAGAMWDSAGSTALGKVTMLPQTLAAKYFEVTDGLLGKVVGGKMAAILSGSTLFQAVWSKVGSKLFGSGYQTKDTGIELGVSGGMFDAQQYTKQKKKGGWLSGSSKTRYLYNALDAETEDALGAAYNEKILNSMGLFSALGVQLSDSVLDGLNVAATRISTQGKTSEAIQAELDTWFTSLGNSAVSAINIATASGLENYNFETLTTFVNNLYSVNGSFEMLNLKLYDVSVSTGFMAEQLIAMAGGMEAFNTANSTFFDNFYTDAEKADYALLTVNRQFAAMGVTLPGTRDAYRDMVEALDKTTESGRQMYVTLTSMSASAGQAYSILEQRADAAAAALMGSVANAMSAIQRAVSAEKDAATKAYNARTTSLNDMVSTATENVSGLTSVGNELSAALKALRGDSDDAVKMLRAQAQATLQSALAAARSGGSLSGITGLSDALDAVSTSTTDLYSTLEDFNRERGRTANVVAELSGLGGNQLTAAEQTVKTLQDQLDQAKQSYDEQMAQFDQQESFAQAQLDALNGVDTSVKAVKDAVTGMNYSVVAALGAIQFPASSNTPENNGVIIDTLYKAVLGRAPEADGKAYWTDKLQSGALSYQQIAEQVARDALAFDSSSYTGPVSQDALAASKAAAKAYLKSINVPGFAAGGFHSGGIRLVGENGPELAVTGPERIYNASQTAAMLSGGSNASVVAELRAVRAELESIKANTQAGALNGGKLVRTMDRVTDGGNAMLTKAAS